MPSVTVGHRARLESTSSSCNDITTRGGPRATLHAWQLAYHLHLPCLLTLARLRRKFDVPATLGPISSDDEEEAVVQAPATVKQIEPARSAPPAAAAPVAVVAAPVVVVAPASCAHCRVAFNSGDHALGPECSECHKHVYCRACLKAV